MPSVDATQAQPEAQRRPWGQVVRRWTDSPGMRQGILALVDQCLASATTFLTMMILARACSQDELGIYSLCFSIVLFACVMQERSLSAPYLAFVHQHQGESAVRLLGSTFVHQAILAALISLCLFLYAGILIIKDGFTTMSTSTLVIGIAVPMMMLRDFIRSISFAHLQLSSALLVDGLVFLLQISGLAALWFFVGLTIPCVFLIIGTACFLASAIWLFRRPLPLTIRWGEVRSDWRNHWHYARWLVFGRLLGNGSRICMPWIVAALLNLSAAGVLAACGTLAGISWVFVRGMNNLLQPRTVRAFHNRGPAALKRELVRTAVLYCVVLGGMALAFLVIGEWLLVLLFGKEFGWATAALVLLGFNSLLTGLAMTSSNGLAALQRPKGNFLGEAATFAVTVVSAIPLVLAYGITGAAIAMVAGSLASFVVMTAILRYELRQISAVGE